MRHDKRIRRYALLVSPVFVCAVLGLPLYPTGASALFHLAHSSEVLTSYDGSADVQFVEITMEAGSQNFVAGTKLNVFDAQGGFTATVLTVPSDVASGSGRPWLMGTPAFQSVSGVAVDFEFPNAALPVDGGMICWGKAGNAPTPVSCPPSGAPYVDCVAYGSYAGPSNGCIGTRTPLVPRGHGLRRVADTHDNANDFACADPATPQNNARATVELPATTPCGAVTTSTLPVTTSTSTTSVAVVTTTTTVAATTTVPVTSTTAPVVTTTTVSAATTTLPGSRCGDANGDGAITAADALAVLRTAVDAASCSVSVCDVDHNGTISASDALFVLRAAVDPAVELQCGD